MQAGSYGEVLPFQTDQDLTSTQTLELRIQQPGQPPPVPLLRPLNASNIQQPPTSGIVTYQTVSGDFPIDGIYTLELIDTTSGRNVIMQSARIYVHPSI